MLKRILGAVSSAAVAGSALAPQLKAEIDKWGPLIKKAGVYAD